MDMSFAHSRRNSLTSLSGQTQTQATIPRSLSTDQLISLDNKFIKKTLKKTSSPQPFSSQQRSQSFTHISPTIQQTSFARKSDGAFLFPNGEIFRPRTAPMKRNRPPKIAKEESARNPATSFSSTPTTSGRTQSLIARPKYIPVDESNELNSSMALSIDNGSSSTLVKSSNSNSPSLINYNLNRSISNTPTTSINSDSVDENHDLLNMDKDEYLKAKAIKEKTRVISDVSELVEPTVTDSPQSVVTDESTERDSTGSRTSISDSSNSQVALLDSNTSDESNVSTKVEGKEEVFVDVERELTPSDSESVNSVIVENAIPEILNEDIKKEHIDLEPIEEVMPTPELVSKYEFVSPPVIEETPEPAEDEDDFNEIPPRADLSDAIQSHSQSSLDELIIPPRGDLKDNLDNYTLNDSPRTLRIIFGDIEHTSSKSPVSSEIEISIIETPIIEPIIETPIIEPTIETPITETENISVPYTELSAHPSPDGSLLPTILESSEIKTRTSSLLSPVSGNFPVEKSSSKAAITKSPYGSGHSFSTSNVNELARSKTQTSGGRKSLAGSIIRKIKSSDSLNPKKNFSEVKSRSRDRNGSVTTSSSSLTNSSITESVVKNSFYGSKRIPSISRSASTARIPSAVDTKTEKKPTGLKKLFRKLFSDDSSKDTYKVKHSISTPDINSFAKKVQDPPVSRTGSKGSSRSSLVPTSLKKKSSFTREKKNDVPKANVESVEVKEVKVEPISPPLNEKLPELDIEESNGFDEFIDFLDNTKFSDDEDTKYENETIRKVNELSQKKKIDPIFKDDELTKDQIIELQIKDNDETNIIDDEVPIQDTDEDFYIDDNLIQLKNDFQFEIIDNFEIFNKQVIPKTNNDSFMKHTKQFKGHDLVVITDEIIRHPTKSDEPAKPILKKTIGRKHFMRKEVLFSNKIFINETYPPDMYKRYNKSVTQYTLCDPVEIRKIKNELNEFKSKDMIVHEFSQQNTHFFYEL